ncbi:DUF1579 family protein [Dyadobacter fermentans]|uniref:DUF1579 domain-containing protein n=1 Tax=Dyadobacter fermentans (strain ATCC 700827 / DSM 18053 / CIP 107007 / KCTC 52180 / NS114) TaxID=471854 RepID=C6VVK7_DYAFD|nr:DUF1579 family protein [Dyadobacter fermentans]ACT96737.1 hypothetical protein Dfer_5547 [Dyadobacter fermentans DSM 18053]
MKTMNSMRLGMMLAGMLLMTGLKPREVPFTPKRHTIPEAKRALATSIIGRWITQTTTVAKNGSPAKSIIGSDVYQWSPDGNFIVHTAYGIGDNGPFGAMEIIGYNPETGDFSSYNFNPDGTFNIDKLTISGNTWVWTGKEVRSTGTLSADRRTLTVKHEITSDGKHYEPHMNGLLTRGAEY